MSGDKSRLNGNDPAENGSKASEDVEMKEDAQTSKKTAKTSKGKDGDGEMVVVVPPAKRSTSTNAPDKANGTDLTNGAGDGDNEDESEAPVDPQEKTISGKLDQDDCFGKMMLTTTRDQSQSSPVGTRCQPV